MKLTAPKFWWQRELTKLSKVLAPIGLVYGLIAAKRIRTPFAKSASRPVICIGNLVVGGAGKTPTTIALSRLLGAKGLRCGFLLRGYGGKNEGPLLVAETHTVEDVGDEALLYAAIGPTAVSADRPAGADLLSQENIDIILMDDGFQNPSLKKDFSIIVVDAENGWGNGLCFPAGPLRASLNAQLPYADAVLSIGDGAYSESLEMLEAQHGFPLLKAAMIIDETAIPDRGNSYLAFSGIGMPEKFYNTLRQNGFDLPVMVSYPDHHIFSETDAAEILKRAEMEHTTPVTTSKDLVRLADAPANSSRAQLYNATEVLNIKVAFADSDQLFSLIEKAIKS